MEPLLRITTIPMAYKLNIINAKLEYSSQKTELNITREKGRLNINSRPASLKIDTFEARASLFPSPLQSTYKAAEKGKAAAFEATARCAKEGRMMSLAKPGVNVNAQIDSIRNAKPTGQFMIGFIPGAGPNIEWIEPSFSMEYQADRLNFDCRVLNGNIEFKPGKIEMEITQYPEVVIEYLGKPIYVPPSAMQEFTYMDTSV